MNSLKEIVDVLLRNNQFVITGHIDPDGDSVGSMLALAYILVKLDKKVRMVLEKPLPIHLKSLEKEWDFIFENDFSFRSDDEVLIILDSGDTDRIPAVLNDENAELVVINIDHHLNNPLFGNYNYVDSKAAAVGEIIFLLCQEMDVEIDTQIGYYIAVALVWDTGCFKFSNTSPRVLRIAADLMEKGIDISQIYKEFLGSHPLSKLRLRGLVFTEMKMAYNGKVAWIAIDQDMLDRAGANLEDVSSISGDLRDIRGVEVGVSLFEREPGLIQLGLRSNNYVPVNEIATYFGGGGHKRAAGARFRGNLNEAVELVLNKIGEYLE